MMLNYFMAWWLNSKYKMEEKGETEKAKWPKQLHMLGVNR